MDWYTKFFSDWGVDRSQEYALDAHSRYVTHTSDMKKKGWSPDLVQALQTRSQRIAQDAHDQIESAKQAAREGGYLYSSDTSGARYWRKLAEGELEAMRNAGFEPENLPKIGSHIAFLNSASDAAITYEDTLAQYTPGSIIDETFKETKDDVIDTGKKDYLPWVVAGFVFWVLFKR